MTNDRERMLSLLLDDIDKLKNYLTEDSEALRDLDIGGIIEFSDSIQTGLDYFEYYEGFEK